MGLALRSIIAFVSLSAVFLTGCDGVRMRSAAGSRSSAPADQTAPTVVLTAPNGGEVWGAGSSRTITWTATDAGGIAVNSVFLAYTTNGTTWIPIASGEANDGTYTWTVPAVSSATVKVRVTATDAAGNSNNDASDGSFTINNTAPAVTVTSPNGGEVWKGGSTHALTWTATSGLGIATNSIALEYTTNGTTWTSIATGEANDGTYTWTVPSISSATVKVRVTATDTSGLNGSDLSNANFTIDSAAPTIAVTSPNGNEIWNGASSHAITWTATDNIAVATNSVVLEYTTDGSTWNPIASGEANDGTYTWTVPSIDSGTVKVRITALDTAGNSASDLSDLDFTIHTTPTPITYHWTFNSSSSYVAATGLDFSVPGVCQLSPTGFIDQDNTVTGFGGAHRLLGTLYGSLSNGDQGVKTGSANGCDASVTNCNEFDSSWTPKWSNVVGLWHLNGSGALSDNAVVPAAVGPAGTAKNANGSGMSYGAAHLQSGVTFDGVDDYITVGQPAWSFASGFSISFWVKPTAASDAITDGPWNATGGLNIILFNSSHLIARFRTDAGQVDFDSFPTPDEWHHYVLTWKSATGDAKLYADGSLINTLNRTGNFALAATSDLIFNNTGAMDEIAIWNSELSASEAAAIYHHQGATRSGQLVSRVMDGAASQTFTSLSWKPLLPYQKPLPDATCTEPCTHNQNETSANYPALVGSTGTAGDDNLMSGIVGLYHLDELAPGTAPGALDFKDTSGNGNHLTADIGPGSYGQEGIFSRGADFQYGGRARFSTTPTVSGSFTVSAWVKHVYNGGQNKVFFGSRSGADTSFDFKILPNGDLQTNIGDGSSWLGNQSITAGLAPNTWYHLAMTVTPGTNKIYLNGNLFYTGTLSAGTPLLMDATRVLCLGQVGYNSEQFRGSIDEAAIWSRALHASEIAQLYIRGTGQLKTQIRVCTAADCSEDPNGTKWQGPDGTSGTFFTELYNRAVQGANPSGAYLVTRPYFNFPAFSSMAVTGRYIQYKALLESRVSSGPAIGELKLVSIGSQNFSTGNPAINGTTGPAFTTLTGFVQTLGSSCNSGIGYLLSIDNTVWYYWNGAAWTVSNSTIAQTSDANTIHTHIGVFPGAVGTGRLYFKALLKSTGTTPCELDDLYVTGTF